MAKESPPPGTPRDAQDRLPALLRSLLPYVPVMLATLWLAKLTIGNVLEKAHEPAVPLDDAYIHFQYARSLAEGRFFAFVPGEGYTSGATSLLWPLALAPFYALGFRDTSIIWIAWIYGFSFLGLLAVETRRLAQRLVGDLASIGAGAAVLCFSGYTWFAVSGMEVSPLAWTLCVTARLAADWAEQAGPEGRTKALRNKLLWLSLLGPLVRPEGMIASGIVLLTLGLFPADGSPVRSLAKETWKPRAFALFALGGPLVPPLINRVLTGHWATTTTLVKWLPPNPYYGGANLWGLVKTNFETFHGILLDGREWSALFLPSGSRPFMLAAFFAIGVAGHRSGKAYRAFLVLLLAASMALPTTYLSFLWNRLRYLWPFAFAWCIALACLSTVMADLASYFRPRFVVAAGLLTGLGCGLLAHQLSWTIDDVSGASSAIHRQQVALGRWAKNALPKGSSIGVSDTGAIAYFGEHRTFDVVGLTTPTEARYWVAGAGARYEHYERLHRDKPGVLPSHFILYPNWMACDAVLGRELHRATVTDSTILGGTTMIAYEADYTRLGLGELPQTPVTGTLVDSLDVADLESEEAHRYEVHASLAADADVIVFSDDLDDGKIIYDGGRNRRSRDVFRLRLPSGGARLVARWASHLGTGVAVKVDGKVVDRVEIPPTGWLEHSVEIDRPTTGEATATIEVEARDGRTFGSLHYWVYPR